MKIINEPVESYELIESLIEEAYNLDLIIKTNTKRLNELKELFKSKFNGSHKTDSGIQFEITESESVKLIKSPDEILNTMGSLFDSCFKLDVKFLKDGQKTLKTLALTNPKINDLFIIEKVKRISFKKGE